MYFNSSRIVAEWFFFYLHADAFILNQKKRTNIQKQFIKFAFIFVYLMLVASFDAFPSTQTKHINPMFYGSSKRIVIFWKKILIFVVDEWFLFVLALVWWKKIQKYTVSSFKIINLNTQTRQLWAALHSKFRWITIFIAFFFVTALRENTSKECSTSFDVN